jgi:tetratricopeptide (TPR) repeat protein
LIGDASTQNLTVPAVTLLVVSLLIAPSNAQAPTRQTQGHTAAANTAAALALYDRGQYSEFIAAISAEGSIPRDLFKTFAKDAARWVSEGQGPDRPRRAIVAASVALEIAHVVHDEAPEWPGEYLVWAVRTVRANLAPAPTAAERAWYLAALAAMEELQTEAPLELPEGRHVVLQRQHEVDRSGGLLGLAESRVPEEPRFKLAHVEALEYRIGLFDRAPAFDDFLAHRAATGPPTDQRPIDAMDRKAAAERFDAVNRYLRGYARVPEIIRAYEGLSAYPTLRPEIALRIGVLESISNPHRALALLRSVPSGTSEAYLIYLCHYFAGRTFQRLGDHSAAIAEFEQALGVIPNARAATTMLCAELVLTGGAAERERAARLLRASLTGLAPPDPWALYYHGDARLWPVYVVRLRETLK